MPAIKFEAKLYAPDAAAKMDKNLLVTVPKSASDQLPSRGMTIVEGTLNGVRFRVPLEPDGQASHWFAVSTQMRDAAAVSIGDKVAVTVEPAKVWPEPTLTADLQQALADDPVAHARWMDTTTLARWDWLRWVDAVKTETTRAERPQKLCSMLKAGKRRPCCFNRALQTPPKCTELL